MKKGKFRKFILYTLIISMLSVCLVFPLEINAADAEAYAFSDADKTWYGDGSASDFAIKTRGELAYLAELGKTVKFTGKTINLASDIVWNEGVASESGFDLKNATDKLYNWSPIGPSTSATFEGTFNGGGHTISGLYITGKSNLGFFGVLKNSTVKNLHFENVYFAMSGSYGGILASNTWGNNNITNVTVNDAYMINSATDSDFVGGLLGPIAGTSTLNKITGCAFSGIIVAHDVVGGLIAMRRNTYANYSISLKDCVSYADITANSDCGGLMGRICGETSFERCHFFGKLTVTEASASGNYGYLARVEQDGKTAAGAKNVSFTDCYTIAGAAMAFHATDNAFTVSVKNGKDEATTGAAADVATLNGKVLNTAGEEAAAISDTVMVDCQEGHDGNAFKVRFVAGLYSASSSKYVGFKIKILYEGGYKELDPVHCVSVYKTIDENCGAAGYKTADVGSEYLYALIVENVPAQGTVTFIVSPFNSNTEDTFTYGESSIVTFVDGAFAAIS